LAQQLALSVSRSEAFLNHRVSSPRSVLLVDLENRAVGVNARFEVMAEPHPGDARIYVYAPETLSQDRINASVDGVARLHAFVERSGADLVVVDTWRLFCGGDENSPEATVKALKALSSLRARNSRLSVVVVHHLRKERMDAPTRLTEDAHSWVESVSGHHA